MGSRRKTTPVIFDVLAGAAAGVLGTFLMAYGQKAVGKAQSEEAQKREKEGSFELSATGQVAKRLAEPFGVELDGEKAERAGMFVHYGFGAAQGALFGLLARKWQMPTVLRGVLFGSALWFVADEVLVPALKLGPSFSKVPLSSHLKALAAHLVYGSSADVGLRTLHRAASVTLH